MGFQCVPQIMGLVWGNGMRQDGKGQAKHRASARGIIHEAFEISDAKDGTQVRIRKAVSETYDRTRTKDNRYMGYRTADDVVAALEAAADAHPVPVQTKDKETGKTVTRYRPLPSNAVIGVTVIHHPPCEIARDWTPEQYDKFIRDSREVMSLIQCGGQVDKKTGKVKRGRELCNLFVPENMIASAMHWDEGSLETDTDSEEDIFTGHWHDVFIPADAGGNYRGVLIDGIFTGHLSRVYPAMMRERGWDIDDCDCTDWDEYKENETYRRERKRKIKEGGQPTNKHRTRARRRRAEANEKKSRETLEQVVELKRDVDEYAERTRREADDAAEKARRDKEQAEADAEKAKQEQEDAEQAADEALQKRQFAEMGLNVLDGLRTSAQEEIQELEEQRKQLGAVRAELGKVVSERDAAVSERDAAKTEAEALRKNKVAAAEQAAAEAVERERARIEAEIRQKITKDAEAARDAARAEADELRRTMVAQAEQAAEARRKELDSAIDKAKATLAELQAKIDDKLQAAERKAQRIIDVARRTADSIRAAAEGEHAFLIDYFSKEPFIVKTGKRAGKSYLDIAREAYGQQLRNERLKAMPTDVRDAGRSHSDGLGGPTGPGT